MSVRKSPSRVRRALECHPLADLFPDLPPSDFATLVADIREHGVKLPILLYEGRILDGRHRYRACQQLGISCPMVEWNGHSPWFEVQSRNLLRRHLAKEQLYAIRKLAAERFPELAGDLQAVREEAARRKAQAKGQPRGVKALQKSSSRNGESADRIGEQLGISGATVKRVDRLARLAPALLPKVAAGELSATKGLRLVIMEKSRSGVTESRFDVNEAAVQLRRLLRSEWRRWPGTHRQRFLTTLKLELQHLIADMSIIRPPQHEANGTEGREFTLPAVAAELTAQGATPRAW